MAGDPQIDFGATVRAFAPGMRVFNRFRLVRFLGRGGMGVVWLARDEHLELDVAVKFLPEAVGADEAAVADMARETRQARALAHPHIIRVFDFHQDAALAAISMEFIDGSTLASLRLKRDRAVFEPDELGPWVQGLSDALDYAHRRARIVHRDLKPANLMVGADGEIKIADFGISASVTDSVTRVSKVASSSGSPPYMSPQQMMGERPAPADDIYSFGATLYELLTSKPPFFAGNIAMQAQSKVPPSLAERRAELGVAGAPLPPNWETTIAACLAKNPADRPAGIREVAARLSAPAAIDVRSPPPVTPAQSASLPALSPDSSALTGALSSALEPTKVQDGRVRSARPASKGWLLAAGVALLLVVSVFAHRWWQGDRDTVGGRALAVDNEVRDQLPRDVEPVTPAGPSPDPVVVADAVRGASAAGVAVAGTSSRNLAAAAASTLVLTLDAVALDGSQLQVKVDGVVRPPDRRQSGHLRFPGVASGVRQVTIEHPAFETWQSAIDVKGGSDTTVAVKLTPRLAQLSLVVTGPSAYQFTVDGDEVVVREGKASIPAGRPLRLRLVSAGFRPEDRELTLASGAEATWEVRLQEQELPREGRPWAVPDVGINLAWIPPGKFTMGSPASEAGRSSDESPLTEVRITRGFWLGVREVSQGEWRAIMETNPSRFSAAGQRAPVEQVSWHEALEFCQRLTDRERAAGRLPEGLIYDLPTEAQWEYACRAQTSGAFSFGASANQLHQYGNFADVNVNFGWRDAQQDDGVGESTGPGGRYRANGFGLHDMHGNVWEWCLDRYASALPGGVVQDPTGPAHGAARVARGGSWNFASTLSRSASRLGKSPSAKTGDIGFRVAMVVVR